MNPSDEEPVYPVGSKKAFLSPVFLVDPMYTEFKKDEDIQVFRDNDFGGWEQPRIQSRFPLIRKEVQKYFGVGDDSCEIPYMKKEVRWLKPRYRRLRIPKKYKPVLEPLYRKGIGRVPTLNQHTCYRGDDYGGHNIPFPIPAPPKPDSYYDDSFVDLGSYYGFV